MAESAHEPAVELPDLGEKPNQPLSFKFPKRTFGQAKPVFRCVNPAWFQKWPWSYYDQANDKMFCYPCVQAVRRGSVKLVGKKKDAFLTAGYTNWKDASGDKKGGFPTHERSEVSTDR